MQYRSELFDKSCCGLLKFSSVADSNHYKIKLDSTQATFCQRKTANNTIHYYYRYSYHPKYKHR